MRNPNSNAIHDERDNYQLQPWWKSQWPSATFDRKSEDEVQPSLRKPQIKCSLKWEILIQVQSLMNNAMITCNLKFEIQRPSATLDETSKDQVQPPTRHSIQVQALMNSSMTKCNLWWEAWIQRVNRQPGYRRWTRRAFSVNSSGIACGKRRFYDGREYYNSLKYREMLLLRRLGVSRPTSTESGFL